METGALKARLKARRAVAASQHSRAACSHAPRPGRVAGGSGTTSPFTLANRVRCALGERVPQPMQRRRGSGLLGRGLPKLLGADAVGVLVRQSLMRVETAVARARQRSVRAA